MMTRWIWVPLVGLSVGACGGDAKSDKAKASDAARKKADKKADEDDNGAERAERLCEARCARNLRCADDEEDVPEEDVCMHTCRLDENPWMHVYRTRFVDAYADCLDRLPCAKEVGRCEAVAVATVLEPPKDPDAEDDDDKKKDKKAKKDKDAKKKPAAKKQKKAKKKTAKERAEERKRARQTRAAKQARALFDRCHERRMACLQNAVSW